MQSHLFVRSSLCRRQNLHIVLIVFILCSSCVFWFVSLNAFLSNKTKSKLEHRVCFVFLNASSHLCFCFFVKGKKRVLKKIYAAVVPLVIFGCSRARTKHTSSQQTRCRIFWTMLLYMGYAYCPVCKFLKCLVLCRWRTRWERKVKPCGERKEEGYFG